MLRGVWFFLIFVVAISGWGMYFYQSALRVGYQPMDVYQKESSTLLDTIAEESQQKEKLLKETEAKMQNILKEKEALEKKYSELLSRVEKIEETYQGIIQDNVKLKNKLSRSEYRVGILEANLKEEKENKSKLLIKLQTMEGELEAVKLENKVLKAKVRELNSTLSSLPKLKQAIRDLKARIYFERKQKQQEKDKIALQRGNKGYVVFNGKPTIGEAVSVEVLPAFD